MQPGQLNIRFTKPFKQNRSDYLFLHTRRFGNVLVEEYDMSGKRPLAYIASAADRAGNSRVTGELLETLKYNDLLDTTNLGKYVRRTAKVFALCAQAEPCSAKYYNGLANLLHPFILLIESYRELLVEELIKKIELFLFRKSSSAIFSFYSDDVETFQSILAGYLDSLKKLYSDFNILLRHESEENHKAGVTSHVEQHLLRLTALIEVSLINTDCLIGQFEDWKNELAKFERQEMYN